jgi:hypothetical protein
MRLIDLLEPFCIFHWGLYVVNRDSILFMARGLYRIQSYMIDLYFSLETVTSRDSIL